MDCVTVTTNFGKKVDIIVNGSGAHFFISGADVAGMQPRILFEKPYVAYSCHTLQTGMEGLNPIGRTPLARKEWHFCANVCLQMP